jgi:D-alanyl-D-alanine carboxypeptidase
MTADDLALWDISLMEHKLLTPASIEAMATPVRLWDRTATNYALGLTISGSGRNLILAHGGGISGFTSFEYDLA